MNNKPITQKAAVELALLGAEIAIITMKFRQMHQLYGENLGFNASEICDDLNAVNAKLQEPMQKLAKPFRQAKLN